jgi:hypothetical protein
VVVEKIPLFILSALCSLITLYAQSINGAIASLSAFSITDRIGNAVVSCLLYIYKMFWPANLAIIYSHPETHPGWLLIISTLFLLTVSLTAVRTIHTQPWIMAGWLWFLITITPVIGIIQVGIQAMADRYTYIPLIGIFIMLAFSCRYYIKPYDKKDYFQTTSALIILIVLAITCRHQLSYWRDSITLYKRALEVTDNNYVIANSLGFELIKIGKYDEAKEYFKKSIEIDPDFPYGLVNYGRSLEHEGNLTGAIKYYKKCLQAQPDFSLAHKNLSNLYYSMGRLEEAKYHYQEAIRYDPFLRSAETAIGDLRSNNSHQQPPHDK